MFYVHLLKLQFVNFILNEYQLSYQSINQSRLEPVRPLKPTFKMPRDRVHTVHTMQGI